MGDFLEIIRFVVNDMAINIFFDIIYDFVENAFYRTFVTVERHYADLRSLPFVLEFKLRKGNVVFFRQAAFKTG
jgi:hypothetical protein